jgi:hypothetical protein
MEFLGQEESQVSSERPGHLPGGEAGCGKWKENVE